MIQGLLIVEVNWEWPPSIIGSLKVFAPTSRSSGTDRYEKVDRLGLSAESQCHSYETSETGKVKPWSYVWTMDNHLSLSNLTMRSEVEFTIY